MLIHNNPPSDIHEIINKEIQTNNKKSCDGLSYMEAEANQGTSNGGDNTQKSQVLLTLTNAYNDAISEDYRKAILTLEDNVRNGSKDISNVKTTVINGETYLYYSDVGNTMLYDHATEACKTENDGGPAYGDKERDNDWIREGYTWATNSGW